MSVIMCTQKLWKRVSKSKLPRFDDVKHDVAGKLGNWSAKLVTLKRRPFAVFANQTTRMCVIVRVAPARTMFERFPSAVEAELIRLGIDADTAHREAGLLLDAPVATNADRSLLGSLNQLAYYVAVVAETERWLGTEPDHVAWHSKLNTMPHGDRNCVFADQAVRALFGVPEPKRQQNLSEFTLRRVARSLTAFCERVPQHVRHQLRHKYRVEESAVTLFEERPAHNAPTKWISIDVARCRYEEATGYWRLFYTDRHGHWHLYAHAPATPDIDELLEEVKRDPTSIFFG